MTEPTFELLLKQLNDLLERERTALLAGDLAALPGLLDETERAIATLESCKLPDREKVEKIQSKIVRNQSLISGAIAGIQDVSIRMKAIRRARGGLETYDHAGIRTRYTTTSPGKVEKRA